MSRRTVVVTGGTSGIGEQCASKLAKLGYHVILTSRTQEKGEQTVNRIKQSINQSINQSSGDREHGQSTNQSVFIEARTLDLTNFDSIRAFASSFDDQQLHILVCNAGSNQSIQIPNVDLDGLWVNNYLGHFYLAQLLLPCLERSCRLTRQPSRVIALSSLMHRFSFLNNQSINQVGLKPNAYSYCDSKLAMTLMAFEIHRRYANRSIDQGQILGIAVNPGAVRSEIWRNVYPIVKPVYDIFMRVMYLDPAQGAETSVKAATLPHQSIKPDHLLYLTPYSTSSWNVVNTLLDAWMPPFLMNVTESPASQQALDAELAKQLWTISEKQVQQVLTSRSVNQS